MNREPDHYSVLGVARDATAEQIKHAYRRLALQTHPDRRGSDGANERFRRVRRAYEVLHDPQSRRRYDLESSAPPRGDSFAGFSQLFSRLMQGLRTRAATPPDLPSADELRRAG